MEDYPPNTLGSVASAVASRFTATTRQNRILATRTEFNRKLALGRTHELTETYGPVLQAKREVNLHERGSNEIHAASLDTSKV